MARLTSSSRHQTAGVLPALAGPSVNWLLTSQPKGSSRDLRLACSHGGWKSQVPRPANLTALRVRWESLAGLQAHPGSSFFFFLPRNPK